MRKRRFQSGFTLIELLLVVGIVAILSAIAIPSLLGAKDHAKYVGEARANAQILRMALESFKSDNGAYPAIGPHTWTGRAGSSIYAGPANPIPAYQVAVQGSSALELQVLVNATGTAYTLRSRDVNRNRGYFTMNQNGVETAY